jgi:uncharacterized protein YjbI with pentapeptide repeats
VDNRLTSLMNHSADGNRQKQPINTTQREQLEPQIKPAHIKLRFDQLYRTEDPFEFQYQLIQIAKDWNITLEECRLLWEHYHQSRDNASKPKRLLKGTWEAVQKVGSIIVTLGQFSLVVGIILFIAEAGTRQKKAVNEAWQVINGVDPSKITASAGRIEALESLNKGCVEQQNPPLGLSVAAWTGWRQLPLIRGFYAECINLTGLNLRQAHLSGVQLPWAQLQEANLETAHLEGVNLQDAQLQNALMSKAALDKANLRQANLNNGQLVEAHLVNATLRDANLFKADLSHADLRGADLRGVNFVNANLYGAKLKGAIFDQQTQPFDKIKDWFTQQGVYFIDRAQKTEARLEKADLRGVDLSDTNLREANLRGTNLRDANLQNADLTQANLERSNLRGTNFRGAIADRTTRLSRALYDSETQKQFPSQAQDLLKQAYKIATDANLQAADLAAADLRGADLASANLAGANLAQADLRGADLSHANLAGANLSKTIYDVTTKIPEAFRESFEKAAYNIDF